MFKNETFPTRSDATFFSSFVQHFLSPFGWLLVLCDDLPRPVVHLRPPPPLCPPSSGGFSLLSLPAPRLSSSFLSSGSHIRPVGGVFAPPTLREGANWLEAQQKQLDWTISESRLTAPDKKKKKKKKKFGSNRSSSGDQVTSFYTQKSKYEK